MATIDLPCILEDFTTKELPKSCPKKVLKKVRNAPVYDELQYTKQISIGFQ